MHSQCHNIIRRHIEVRMYVHANAMTETRTCVHLSMYMNNLILLTIYNTYCCKFLVGIGSMNHILSRLLRCFHTIKTL